MSGLTDEERELKRLAEGATPGPWQHEVKSFGDPIDFVFAGAAPIAQAMGETGKDAALIAAANPTTVLRLLARIEELEERVRDFENDEHMRVRRMRK